MIRRLVSTIRRAAVSFLLSRSRRLDLLDHARTLGRSNLPPPTALEPSEGEADVIRDAEQAYAELAEATAREIRAAAASFEAVAEQLPTVESLKGKVHDAMADVQRELAKNRHLGVLWAERERRRLTEAAFRHKHLLHREPDRTSLLLQVGVLLGVIVLEAVLNCTFFAQTSRQGYEGGLFLASAASFVNVLLGALFVGFLGLRSTIHVDPRVRWFGRAVVVLFLPAALAWGLVVGHLRDNPAPKPDWQAVLHHPFDLSLASWGLFAIGCGVFAFSIYEGYEKLDDRYWGYGKVAREFQAADERYRRERDALRGAIVDRIRSIPKEADALVLLCAKLLRILDRYGQAVQRLAQEHDTDRGRIGSRCELNLRHWRTANTFARSAPPPAYFTEYPTLSDFLDRVLVERIQARLAVARVDLENLKAAAHQLRSDNAAQVRAATEEFDAHLAAQFHEDDDADRRQIR